jgi:peptidoglycan/xylan/chitin deacetylase (PgdA/CDA1 family)
MKSQFVTLIARLIFFFYFVLTCFICAADESPLSNISLAATSISEPLPQATCTKPVYLTFDTGHMQVAPLISDILQRQHVHVTYFAAHEPTKEGDGSLGETWAHWWNEQAKLGNSFASHTYDHVYWQADLPNDRFIFKPSSGALRGQKLNWGAKEYCSELKRSSDRLQEITGIKPLPLFRAPGGKTSAQLLRVARACGYAHVGWAEAGFLGDELDSKKYPNQLLLIKALENIRSGDILMAHLGIWSRQDPWAPSVLEPLILGLKERGFCFDTLSNHPHYKKWISESEGTR